MFQYETVYCLFSIQRIWDDTPDLHMIDEIIVEAWDSNESRSDCNFESIEKKMKFAGICMYAEWFCSGAHRQNEACQAQ